ncbi:MAG TPA: DUF2232 domain-containing protein [Gemmatimonadales bacterium]
MTPGRGWWRLVLGTAALAALAPGSLAPAGLAFAGLMSLGRPAAPAGWLALGVAAGGSAWMLQGGSGTALDGLASAFAVCAATAFVLGAALRPTGVFRQALRAVGWALAGIIALELLLQGGVPWDQLAWDARREASWVARKSLAANADTYAVFEPVVRAISSALPAVLVLGTLAGLALAWQWHTRLARRPLGAPLAAFREFRFGDGWIWGLVGSGLAWVLPVLAAAKIAALNLAIVLGVLYLLRGAAIVVALAAAAGVSNAALVLGAAVAGVLAFPLLVVLPGLWALGVSDTWLEFRRRLASRPNIP